MDMPIKIIDNFLSKHQAQRIRDAYADKLIENKDRPGFFESFGGDPPAEVLLAVALTKIEIEKEYGIIIGRHEAGVVRMTKGAFNGLHSDMYNLDGSSWEDGSERKDGLEFSAIVYLTESGEDFSGGEIVFPQQGLKIGPKTGSLIFFRGDLDHTHKVRHVLSGDRVTIVMFFGKQ
jgi:hypothetical protein